MDFEQEKTTALYPPVGADGGQPLPNLCLNLREALLRPLWRFLSLQQFLFGTFLPCLLQPPLSAFGICVGLNSVY